MPILVPNPKQAAARAAQIKAQKDAATAKYIAKNRQPVAPKFVGINDARGNLQERYSLDPTKSDAFVKLQEQANATPGESPWAKIQQQQQALAESGATDAAAANQAQALAQAQGNLLRQGGLGSGARTRMAEQGAKDLLLAKQDVARQGIMDRLGITNSDIDRQQGLLTNVAGQQLDAQGKNLAASTGDITAKQNFDLNKYQQQMAVIGAGKTADAQVSAAKKNKKK